MILGLYYNNDSVIASDQNYRDKSNLATLTDSVSRQASYNRAPTDDIDLSEDIRFGRGIYHADSVSFSDSILSSVGFNTFPEDIFEFTRSFTKVRFTKAAQDSFEFADSKSFDVATNFVDESFRSLKVSEVVPELVPELVPKVVPKVPWLWLWLCLSFCLYV